MDDYEEMVRRWREKIGGAAEAYEQGVAITVDEWAAARRIAAQEGRQIAELEELWLLPPADM